MKTLDDMPPGTWLVIVDLDTSDGAVLLKLSMRLATGNNVHNTVRMTSAEAQGIAQLLNDAGRSPAARRRR
jgi:hypothetical protein